MRSYYRWCPSLSKAKRVCGACIELGTGWFLIQLIAGGTTLYVFFLGRGEGEFRDSPPFIPLNLA